MSKFVLKNIAAIKGNQQFKQLVVLPDNSNETSIQNEIIRLESQNVEVIIKGQLDIYEDALEKKYTNSFERILGTMNIVANNGKPSGEKYHELEDFTYGIKEYEFKCGDLRIYAIKIYSGKLIIFGGYKNNQKPDISKFRSLKKQYLEFINFIK